MTALPRVALFNCLLQNHLETLITTWSACCLLTSRFPSAEA